MLRALLVDDDANFVSALAELLRQDNFEVEKAGSLEEARNCLKNFSPDIVLVDLVLPDGNGLDLVREKESSPEIKFIVLTGYASIDTAVQALRNRVFDYLPKPIDVDQFRACLQSLKASFFPETQNVSPVVPLDGEAMRFGPIFGASSVMREIYALIAAVAPTDATVLIQGESGTGKELVANALHTLSARKNGPFLAINCGAMPENLIATELFGHERGSFTGANRQHRGFFERANDGTLFLDEVTEMPLDLQVHLLRVLETGTLLRVGGDREIKVNTRIIAATNRQPEQAVRDGKLREDLFYRLQVFPIRLPSLREREEDVLLLADHFLNQLNETRGTIKKFSANALAELKTYDWPGNVRELRNAIERAYLLGGAEIDQQHLMLNPSRVSEDNNDDDFHPEVGNSLGDVERRLIYATLKQCNGNKKMAAATLGVSLKTLYNRLKEYGEVFIKEN